MVQARRHVRPLFVLMMMIATGCESSSDRRLTELAERSAARQQQQNQIIARQAESVVRETQRITEAAKELVAKDAEARKAMIQAQRELQSELQTERSSLDRQREDLDQQRQTLAEQRIREPVIAEAILTVGTLLGSLVPLVIVAYALSRLGQAHPDVEELSELLVRELAGEQPILSPPRSVPALEHHGVTADPPEDTDPYLDDMPF